MDRASTIETEMRKGGQGLKDIERDRRQRVRNKGTGLDTEGQCQKGMDVFFPVLNCSTP